MNFDSILIVTYGRSGSTLLQGILNSIPGCIVRGENYNLLYEFFRAYQKIERIAQHKNTGLSTSPWYGATAYSPDSYLSMISDYIRDIIIGDLPGNEPVTCYGFKEIRYINIQENLFDYLGFLGKIFPNPAFIFNTRNLDDVCRSGWWSESNEQDVKCQLGEIETRFSGYCSANNDGYLLSYEDVINVTPRFEKLYEFLGADFDEHLIRQLLAVPHSYGAKKPKV